MGRVAFLMNGTVLGKTPQYHYSIFYTLEYVISHFVFAVKATKFGLKYDILKRI